MHPTDEKLLNDVVEFLKPLNLEWEDYENFCDIMYDVMSKGLQKSGNPSASIKMYPSYVTRIPDGTEVGTFLALDLGGTNYRVLLVHLTGDKSQPTIEERAYAIPQSIMNGKGQELFDYIAKTLADFLKSHELCGKELPLGFTFSFPCVQKGLTTAHLVRWTKGFTAKDVVGNNVATLLQEAIDKTGCNVKCVAVVNDTVGTLASCALEDKHCAIGLIVGTGTNAAYIERRERVELMEGEHLPFVIVNTEWGAFGENGEFEHLRTPFDQAVDAESLNPGKQIFEKMVSGMYLGEIVRHVLIGLVEKNLLFRGQMPDRLLQKDSVLTKYLSDVEHDPPHLFYSSTFMLTEELNVPVVDPVDSRIVRLVCETVSKRAAYLAGAGIVCLIRRMKRKDITVGIDGSLYKFHPRFRERMMTIVDRMNGKDVNFRLRLSEDGSGKGAAAIAAAATRPTST